MFADISVFENLQRGAHSAMGLSHIAVFNGFVDDEAKRRAEWCDAEIGKMKQEITEIRDELLKAHNSYNFQQYLMERGESDKSRKEELTRKIEYLDERNKQLQATDTDGKFVTVCAGIESCLEDFQTQISRAIDNPARPIPPKRPPGQLPKRPPQGFHNSTHGTPLCLGLSVFNKPSE